MVGRVEAGSVNLTFDAAGGLFDALSIDAQVVARMPYVVGSTRQRDAAHARCSAYVQRRLEADGWLIAREVEIRDGRASGWIDLLAFHPIRRVLLVLEIKTEIDDLGRIERTLAWYVRHARAAAKALGWNPVRVCAWLLLLATEINDDRMRTNRELMAAAFPGREPGLLDALPDRAVAMVDPRSRRKRWLLRTRADDRRTAAPYRDYADFMRRPRHQQ